MRASKKTSSPWYERVPWYLWGILVLGIGAGLFQIIFSFYGTYTHQGLIFDTQRYGDLIMHHHAYYLDAQTKYNLYLRVDPRINMIPGVRPVLFLGTDVALGIDTTGLYSCPDATIGISELALFLAHNRLNVIPGATNASFAKEQNITHVTCANAQNQTIVMLQVGTESRITVAEPRCYVLTIADCQIVPVVEKFIVQAVVDARAYDASSASRRRIQIVEEPVSAT